MNTPEQLADQLTARQASGLWYRSDDAAAELRRLAVENKALRAEAMRFRDDALNEKAARKAVEADRAERQGEAVPDGVWEALQRMIEDGINKGPASRDDAMAVSRWRARFVPARDGLAAPHSAPAPTQQPLSDEECDKLVAEVIDAVAKEKGLDHAMHLNADITSQSTLRRAIVRRAHGIGGEK